MPTYVIDGNNLIRGFCSSGNGPARQDSLIQQLRLFVQPPSKGPRAKVVLVFDGPGPTSQPAPGLTVQHSGQGSADSVIRGIISRASNPRNMFIVSNDSEIRQAARSRRLPMMSCAEFREKLDESIRANDEDDKPTGTNRGSDWLKEFGG